MNLVVGSGPAGVACAAALLDAGRAVTMLDAGLCLEPERQAHVETLASVRPDAWPAESVTAIKEGFRADRRGVPLKHVFGSDFPFRVPPSAAMLGQQGTCALRSFAKGGLSQAWGATLVPFRDADMIGWPIGVADLAPHYEAVMRMLPLSAAEDGLAPVFPTYASVVQDLRPSRQASGLLDDLHRHGDDLARAGIAFGRARLAVDASQCTYCGLCLYGCPYGCIYNAAQSLPQLQRRDGFTYIGNVIVRRASESGGRAFVHARDRVTGAWRHFEGTRVFLAAGAIGTALILAESMGVVDPLPVQSSQAFLVPFLRFKAERHVDRDSAHTLAQIYLLLQDRAIARHTVQLQVYTYSDLFPTVLRGSALGSLFRMVPALERLGTERLMVIQGLMHSVDSDAMSLRATTASSGEMSFVLTGAVSPATRTRVRRVVSRMFRVCRAMGGVPVTPLLTLSLPGQSFHSGGTFPMARSPGRYDSDLLGRVAGFHRVHAVDASVLPTIPSPPLTLTAMANAHRIASCADG